MMVSRLHAKRCAGNMRPFDPRTRGREGICMYSSPVDAAMQPTATRRQVTPFAEMLQAKRARTLWLSPFAEMF
jgi:hypothetical protein